MQVSGEKQIRLADEIKIVPGWAWVLAAAGFVGMQIVFNVVLAHEKDAPPAWGRALLGVLVGTIVICYVLLIGYVNRDAGRRGMSRILWTLVAILVTNGLGVILYFILRQPLQTACPQCGSRVQAGFNFCPKCNYRLGLSCVQCKNVVRPGDIYCPYCGCGVGEPAQMLKG